MNPVTKVLYLEDNPRDAEIVQDKLAVEGLACEFTLVNDKESFEAALDQRTFDLILCDYNLPEYDGLTALRHAQAKQPDVPVVIISGSLDEEEAVRCLQGGAVDYLLKQRLDRLGHAVKRALQRAEELRQRRQAEEKFKQEAAFRECIIDSAGEGICVCETLSAPPGIYFSLWNRQMEEITGYTKKEINRLGWHQTVYPDELTQTRAVERMQRMRAGENLQSEEWRITRKDGQCRDLLISTRVLPGRPDNPQVLAVMHDITAQKDLQARFLRAQRLESIGALASGIVHDLNNAIAPVLMSIDLLREDLPKDERLKFLDIMKTSARRASEMAKQILSFTRGISGTSAPFNLKHLIADIVKMCKETFPPAITLESKVVSDLHPLVGNATQLHQVLLNLCVNARDAMPSGGELSIQADNIVLDHAIVPGRNETVSGPYVLLTISDTGHGMSPEVLNRIFEPFFTTKTPDKGTGLGLSTVQGIVKEHQGFIEVSSSVGEGTTFKVYLPAVGKQETPTQCADVAHSHSGQGELILVVDDDRAILEIVRLTLETFGYRVLTASNGLEALPLFQAHIADIAAVITDSMMPFLDGPATIRMLRHIHPQVKIIGMSGLGSEPASTAASKFNLQGFLKKPYATEQLLATLRTVVTAKP